MRHAGSLALTLLIIGGWLWFSGIRVEPARAPTLPLENNATRRGQDPWATNEGYLIEARNSARKGALAALDQAWSAMCAGEGGGNLHSAVSYYYEQRAGQEIGYPRAWGEAAGRYIKQAWATSDDARIDRLTQETYDRGYLDLARFRPFVRARIEQVIGDTRVTGHPCADQQKEPS